MDINFEKVVRSAIAATAILVMSAPVVLAAETPGNIEAANVQVPGYYRMALGDKVTVTAFYDGPVYLKTAVLQGGKGMDFDGLLREMAVPTTKDGVQTSVNAYLVQQKGRMTLIDSGASDCFGETLGNLVSNIKASGVSPDDVDAVIVTHMHPDHACGATNPDGTAVFKNAEFIAPKVDADYWLSDTAASSVPKSERSFFKAAQRTVAPYKASGRFRTFAKGESPVPGIDSVDEAGHSPGMAGYLINGGDKKLLVWGDVVHSHAVQFKRPEVSVVFDHDPKAAIETRKRIFTDAVKGNLWIAAAHLPFPGLGRVVVDGSAYRWVPVEYGAVR
ncbi:putative quorum-quenching lactonase YtnP [Dickeya dianthicola]|uniref:MBL fold metallo-hydrolase n=2 Tax=Pectobacteriaceae TaxID=1903410 RepID=A0ABX9NME5_9GAMM|nr:MULTISPECIES: MBL fold metallo-hydrolase [Pectobacteriaceae]QQG27148.1 MBL fold metallo-hydrolase [Pectobacterium carotovorum]AYC19739.1 putative quorum-quenching lactonase YtnP [Dickeya dianthicola]MBI0438899.1 MBL fold metallo-hydrolase [Dickeya dianthicola]MBI0449192.1 MBL fold metallo-hydrolase [Dickeya dianthicola]MBI0453696.1 MBL fold metallo-hydrolase [Dickeya dianthicola]